MCTKGTLKKKFLHISGWFLNKFKTTFFNKVKKLHDTYRKFSKKKYNYFRKYIKLGKFSKRLYFYFLTECLKLNTKVVALFYKKVTKAKFAIYY